MGRKKKNYSTKLDNVPHDDELRRDMINSFITENEEDGEVYQVVEAIPYEGSHMVCSTASRKRKPD